MKFKVGAKIQWKWLGRAIQGVVKEVHETPITKTIKGKSIKRNGSVENPAYVVESSVGNLALKLHSELSPTASKKARSKSTPKMFSKD
ncbi:hypothetical protein D3C87_1556640 [compost metagenome]